MTLPRRIVPNATYLVTRRCTQRKFLLKPSPRTTEIFKYCLAVAAQRTGVLVHAVAVMSNHYHAVCTDPEGRLPEFMTYLHRLTAVCMNAAMGRWENFWASEKPSAVLLENDDDILDKIVYTACNPVAAELVAKAAHWPGLTAYHAGKTLTAVRPDVFFRDEGDMAESASITLTPPPLATKLSPQNYNEKISNLVHDEELRIQTEMAALGRAFIGKAAVLAQKVGDSPFTREPRRRLNPTVACKSKWHRIEALRRQKRFILEYREALLEWRRGNREVLFPAGTYALRIHAGVSCAPPAAISSG